MKQLILYSILCLFLSGCFGANWKGKSYKEQALNGKPVEYTDQDEYRYIEGDEYAVYSTSKSIDVEEYFDKKGIYSEQKTDETCVFFIPPLNLWDIRFTEAQTINHAIKRLQREDANLKGLRYIKITKDFGTILGISGCSGWCRSVTGFPIYEDVK